MIPPIGSGTPNSRYSATAPPTISARSVAVATASARTPSPQVTGRGSCSRRVGARPRPAARPGPAVGGGDRVRRPPRPPGDRAGQLLAAVGGQVAAGGQAELGGERLDE